MFVLKRFATMALIVAGGMTGPAIAQQTAQSNPKPGDPNEKICENITVTGSRIGVKRFCGTRAEWADRRSQDREAVEKAQRSPCVIQTTGSTGQSSC